ncbi:MAG: hypothetical protein WC980_06190 [Candidatus Brocadiia bacterium]
MSTAENFRESALEAFGFLVKEFGFKCTQKGPQRVRYESKSVFAVVSQDPQSYKIEFIIGRLPDTAESLNYTIVDIINSAGAAKEAGNTSFQSSDEKTARRMILELAGLVKKYAPAFLAGDDAAFKRLEDMATREEQKKVRQYDLAMARKNAEFAWQKQNFQKVVEFLEPVKCDLLPAELKRLEYCQRMR